MSSKRYCCLALWQVTLLPVVMTGVLVADEIDFATDIQTVLARRCYACHGPDVQEGSLRFDDRATLLVEADSGETPIVPGQASHSELIRRITSEDESERMPPEGKPLSEEEVAAFEVWIDQGAKYERHWSFQPIQHPVPPDVKSASWTRTPMDRFVLKRLEDSDMSPNQQADPTSLVRRLYLDVTGLPPTPEQVSEALADWNEQSYESLVEQLLSDPAFGERWARTWLDVVRFAETNSYERDGVKPNAWKYRDYVIAAMNKDKPYNQFLREQLAGDELENVTPESLTATGYYRLGIWDDEPADPKQALFDGFDDIVSTTSQGMLGLTLNCARCHDHKIDPLTQKDYYSMVAFVRDVTPYGQRGDQKTYSQLDLDQEVAKQYDQFESRRREIDRRTRHIEKQAIEKMSAPDQRATEGPRRREVLDAKLEENVTEKIFQEYSQLRAELADIQAAQRKLPPRETVLALAKLEPKPPQTFVLHRGSPHSEGDPVEPAFPILLGGGVPEIPSSEESARSAGRRRVLADWIASDDNWMTARVIVNRIWLQYFGRGIVRSPNNFGLMGDPPTHPLLLDYLASELIRGDWHLKHIHRTILLSSTYRMSTKSDSERDAKDPANNLFWRQNLRRLGAEQIRDSVLAVTGQLNAQRYGPSMYPRLSADVLASQSRPGSGWGNSSDGDQARRSIYIHVKRSLPVPMLSAFDFPETDISCEARFLTTQPAQALTMLNSEWMQIQAAKLLERVQHEAGAELKAQADRCLQLVLSRQASQEDIASLVDLVGRLQKEHQLTDEQARRAMCLVALNLNEFIYVR